MTVLSMETSSQLALPAKPSNIRCHTPRACQRANRW